MNEATREKRTYTKRAKDVSQAQKLACQKHLKKCQKFAAKVTADLDEMLNEYEQFLKDGPTLLDLK